MAAHPLSDRTRISLVPFLLLPLFFKFRVSNLWTASNICLVFSLNTQEEELPGDTRTEEHDVIKGGELDERR